MLFLPWLCRRILNVDQSCFDSFEHQKLTWACKNIDIFW
jgi:hypothetical protein